MAIIVVNKGGDIGLATDYFEVEHNGEELFKIDSNKDAKFIANVIDGSGNKLTDCYRWSTSNSNTSTKMKIKINSSLNYMICFTVTLYQGYEATKIMISGYNYGNNYWYAPSAVILGDSRGASNNPDINVYFGYDGVNDLWVAFDKSLYTGMSVSDVAVGYRVIENYYNLFTISEVATSSLGTIQSTQVIKRRRVHEFEEIIYYTSSTSLVRVGTWKMPFTGFLEMHVKPIFGNASPIASAISVADNLSAHNVIAGSDVTYSYSPDTSVCGIKLAENTTIYIFTKHAGANSNRVVISGKVTSL